MTRIYVIYLCRLCQLRTSWCSQHLLSSIWIRLPPPVCYVLMEAIAWLRYHKCIFSHNEGTSSLTGWISREKGWWWIGAGRILSKPFPSHVYGTFTLSLQRDDWCVAFPCLCLYEWSLLTAITNTSKEYPNGNVRSWQIGTPFKS